MKLVRILSFFLVLSMVLTACVSADNSEPLENIEAPADFATPGEPGLGETPSDGAIDTPEAAGDETALPMVTPAATQPNELPVETPTTATNGASQPTPETSVSIFTSPVRISHLAGSEVTGESGEVYGVLRDVIIDLQGRQVAYGVLELQTSTSESDGSRIVAVPWNLFTITDGTDTNQPALTFNVDQAALEQAPAAENLEAITIDTAWEDPAREYWQTYQQEAGVETAAGAGLQGALSVSSVLNQRITAPSLGDLGEVNDVIIEPETGMVNYVILMTADIFNLGSRLIPVPLSAIELDAENNLGLTVDPALLLNAPNFEMGALPEELSPGWDAGIQEFWENQ